MGKKSKKHSDCLYPTDAIRNEENLNADADWSFWFYALTKKGYLMKKKIAIVLDTMSMGGIPVACAAFVGQLMEYCDVTMIMRDTSGVLMDTLPPGVEIIVPERYVFRNVVRNMLSDRRFIRLAVYSIPYLFWSRIKNRWVIANKMTAKECGEYIEGEYDCVIAYHGMNIGHLVTALYNVKAKKRIAWIHGDHPFEGVHRQDAEQVYQEFDKIYCVSPVMRERFLVDFPKVESITDSYKNLLSPERINIKAREPADGLANDYRIIIVTVGRISKEKGQDLIPPVLKELEKRSIRVHWYLIGDGKDKNRIKSLAEELNVSDFVTFLGTKANPYPYIKNCDLYVQPSYTEGYCLTVCEAAILCKPIVLTVAAAAGILENGKNAVVTDSSVSGLTDGIEYLATHKSLWTSFSEKLRDEDFSNKNEINKLLEYLRC